MQLRCRITAPSRALQHYLEAEESGRDGEVVRVSGNLQCLARSGGPPRVLTRAEIDSSAAPQAWPPFALTARALNSPKVQGGRVFFFDSGSRPGEASLRWYQVCGA